MKREQAIKNGEEKFSDWETIGEDMGFKHGAFPLTAALTTRASKPKAA
jgi:hypothetical protein